MRKTAWFVLLGGILALTASAEIRIGAVCEGAQFPRIVSDGISHAYAVWQRSVGNVCDVIFNVSSDNGDSWRTENILVGRGFIRKFSLACNQTGSAFVLWQDENSTIVSVFSNNGEHREDILLDVVPSPNYYEQIEIVADGRGDVFALYRGPDFRPRLSVSEDNGRTWQLRAIFSSSGMGYSGLFQDSELHCDSAGTVYCLAIRNFVDAESRPCREISILRSSDLGRTWAISPPIVAWDDGLGEGGYPFNFQSSFYCDASGLVYFVWKDNRNGTADIYLNCSRDFGQTWQVKEKLVNKLAADYHHYDPRIAADSLGHVYVVWEEVFSTNPNFHKNYVYLNYSWDFGESWGGADKKINSRTGDCRVWSVGITCDSTGRVNVAWYETLPQPYSNRIQTSDDYGKTWLPFDNQVNGTDPTSPVWTSAGPPGTAFFVWTDVSRVVFAKCRPVQPPANIQVNYSVNRTLFKKEHYDILSWEDHPQNKWLNIQTYVICWRYASEEDPVCRPDVSVTSDVHSLSFQYPFAEEKRVYAIYAVDSWGMMSPLSRWTIVR